MREEEREARSAIDADEWCYTDTVRPLLAIIDGLRSLPVLRTCGDCAHYADVRDGQCEHPFQRPFPETGRNDAPPAWCPLRRST